MANVFDWLDRPFQVVGHTLKGRPGKAGAHLVDFLTDIPDAFIPGDWIPNLTKEEDFMAGSELIGDPSKMSATARLVADLGLQTGLNPLSYLSFGGAGAAAKLGREAGRASKLAKTAEASLKGVKGGERLAGAAGKGLDEETLADILMRQLSKQGRKDVKGSRALTEQLVREAGGDIEKLQSAVRARPDIFDAGGIRAGIPFTEGKTLVEGERLKELAPSLRGLVPERFRAPVAKGLDTLKEGTRGVGGTLRSALGWEDAGFLGGRLGAAASVGSAATKKYTDDAARILGGLDDTERLAVGDVMHNLRYDEAGAPIGLLDEATDVVDIDKRIESLGLSGDQAARVKHAAEELQNLNKEMLDEWHSEGVFAKVDGDTSGYMPRVFSGKKTTEGDLVESLITDTIGGGSVNAARGRSLKTDEELLQKLIDQPGLKLERDPLKAMEARARAQGTGIQRARVYREVFGDEALANDPVVRQAFDGTIDLLKQNGEASLARSLEALTKGNAPRGLAEKILAKGNRFFKPAAVYGIVIPRVAGMTRNRVGGAWQAMSVAETPIKGNLKRMVTDMRDAFAEGINHGFGTQLSTGELGKSLKLVDEAFANSKSGVAGVKKYLQDKGEDALASAVDAGIFDTFVSTENLVSRIASNKEWMKRMQNAADWPGVAFQGLESRMRLGSYLDLLDAGYTPKVAADIIKDTYLDYSVSSIANRRLRDIIPFGQFLTQSIPQQAKFVARNPAVGTAMGALTGGGTDEPVSPWISDQPSFKVADDTYITGLGLPVEVLADIPSDPESFRSGVIGSAHPLLKSLYGEVVGRDPFFNSKWGSYNKTPELAQALGMPEESEAARIYHLIAETGIAQPFESVINVTNRLLDDDMHPGWRAMNAITGARAVKNDPDRALLQILEREAETNPNVRTYTQLYTGGEEGSPERQLIDEYNRVKKTLREKREKVKALKDEDLMNVSIIDDETGEDMDASRMARYLSGKAAIAERLKEAFE